MDDAGSNGIQELDVIVFISYLIIVTAVGIWASFKNRGCLGGYFLAGRNMHWIVVGASLFASNIGSGHFIGLAGSGAESGIGIAAFELNAIFILILLGWVFIPVYLAAGVYTIPEYMRKRFGRQRIRICLSVISLLLYIFTKISVDLYSSTLFMNTQLHFGNGWEEFVHASILVVLFLSALLSICGGVSAVMWTDCIQVLVMIGGSLYLMTVAFMEVGGMKEMVRKYHYALPVLTQCATQGRNCPENNTWLVNNKTHDMMAYVRCGLPKQDFMNLLREHNDNELPWPGIIFGLSASSLWYWCSDQNIVQKTLAAKNLSHAKAATVFAGYLKCLPLFIIVFPGMIARILYTDQVSCFHPEECKRICGDPNGCSNMAYPVLLMHLIPVGGTRGLMLAVIMAALMSSLISVFTSSSSLFAIDIWRRIRREANDTELMIVGRSFILLLVTICVIWVEIASTMVELFHYIQKITSYFAPPICAVFLLAILWKRINEPGAFFGLLLGFIIGLIRFILEITQPVPLCIDERISIIKDVHYLHFGILLFVVVCIITIFVSFITSPIEDRYLYRLTYWSRYSTQPRDAINYNTTTMTSILTPTITSTSPRQEASNRSTIRDIPSIHNIVHAPWNDTGTECACDQSRGAMSCPEGLESSGANISDYEIAYKTRRVLYRTQSVPTVYDYNDDIIVKNMEDRRLSCSPVLCEQQRKVYLGDSTTKQNQSENSNQNHHVPNKVRSCHLLQTDDVLEILDLPNLDSPRSCPANLNSNVESNPVMSSIDGSSVTSFESHQNELHQDPEINSDEKTSCRVCRIFKCIFGIERRLTNEQNEEILHKNMDIEEKRWFRIVNNINAIVLMSFAVFIWTFFV